MWVKNILYSAVLIWFVLLGCSKKSQVIIRNNFKELKFNKVKHDHYFTHDPYIDTIVNITLINNKNKKIEIVLDSTNVTLNYPFYGKKIKVRENRFVMRFYDCNFNEIYFLTGFSDPDSSVQTVYNLEYIDNSKSHIVRSKETMIFKQKIRLPIINMFNFDVLEDEYFDKIVYGQICLFNGRDEKQYGIEGVVCSEPFLIRH